jgi:hypothetical protein
MKKGIILLFICFSASLQAQNLDSLFNRFVEHRTPSGRIKVPIVASDAEKHKCNFGLMAQIRLNYNKFTTPQRNIIASLLSRPETDTSFVSPKKYFRIHYNNKVHGTNDIRPAYDVNKLAAAADSAYEFEVGYLGYPAPLTDNGAGGDDLYDIYIQEEGSNYGETVFETQTGGNRWVAFMRIDYDFGYYNNYDNFVPFYTTGINAARVTVAHELHHAIQIGNYPFRSEDVFYHEISSTSMEEFVCDDVNDYVQYLPDFFNYSHTNFTNHGGYDLAIYDVFLKERFNYPILKDIWENIKDTCALKAIDLALIKNGSSFINELSNFYTWTFFTGFRSVDGKYFKDARKFPLLKPAMSVNYLSAEKMIMTSTDPVSCNLLLFVNKTLARPDSIFALVTNGDYNHGYSSNTTECSYYLSPFSSLGARQIASGYYTRLTSPVEEVLKDVNILNNVLVTGNNNISAEEISDPFPNPFNYSRHSNVAIPAPKGDSDESLLYIYSINMRPVYSGSLNVIKTDKLFVRWNGLDNNNSRLPNGVYFYFTKRGDSILKGKLVIQNE